MNKETKQVNTNEVVDYKSLPTTSAKIRYLDSLSWTRVRIAKELNIRYQHVRNVLITPIKKARV